MFCAKCGAQLSFESLYCWKCGQKVTVSHDTSGYNEDVDVTAVSSSAEGPGSLLANSITVHNTTELLGAITTAISDAVILLAAGEYVLQQPLQLEKPMSLIGAGRDKTRLTCSEPQYVLRYAGDGMFAAEGISFEHIGQRGANVMVVKSGLLKLQGCSFKGGWRDTEAKIGGHGLSIGGQVSGSVVDCDSWGHTNDGILVAENARFLLESNRCNSNNYGIACIGNVVVTARKNECSRNRTLGISVEGDSSVDLQDNACTANIDGGIAYMNGSKGSALRNYCAGSFQGIRVSNQAQVTLEGNSCENCKGDNGGTTHGFGIAYWDSAGGSILQNKCRGNRYGIFVGGTAQPLIEANISTSNKVGLFLQNETTATVKANEFSDNEVYGIEVIDQAKPTIQNNKCNVNKSMGIIFGAASTGFAGQNICQGNEAGISVSDSSNPILVDNICSANKSTGIAFFSTATGTARQNLCQSNKIGISVKDQSRPTIEENMCVGNTTGGLVYLIQGSGVARRNTCRNNSKFGIMVLDNANPSLENNGCIFNEQYGIFISDQSRCIARKNNCFGNGKDIEVEGRARPTLDGNTSIEPTAGTYTSLDGQWEYMEWVYTLDDNSAYARLGTQVSRAGARLEWWVSLRPIILNRLQPLFEKGWQPLLEIGADCLILSESNRTNFLSGGSGIFNNNTYIRPRQVRIQLRRVNPNVAGSK